MTTPNKRRFPLGLKSTSGTFGVLCVSVSGIVFGCSGDGSDTAQSGLSDAPVAASHTRNYTLFEAGAVRPVAVLDRGTVAVTNIPDDRVELYRPHGHGVKHCGSVKVGLRPVALSVVGSKLWVVNHLSDSVSVVDIDEGRCSGEVERTLLVG